MDIAVAKCFDEHKSVDKAEPKFKVGEWITDGYLHCKISDVLDDRYIVDTKFAKRSSIPFKRENNYHLWTIQDAKDGDILVHGNSILIFKNIEDDRVYRYCNLYLSDSTICTYHIDYSNHFSHIYNTFTPATKEQRDLLFKKMHEEGHEWDADKKKVRKIEHKIAESEDEKIRKDLIKWIEDFPDSIWRGHYKKDVIAWLYSWQTK